MSRRLKAPTANGEILTDPPTAELPRLVEQNRRLLDAADLRIDGISLRDLRALARRELDLPDGPVILTGHQPELIHPGVWVKNFAVNGLAKRVAGVPVNLIADSDTMKSASIRMPTWSKWQPASVRSEAIAFDRFDGETPYEDRVFRDAGLFASFPERVATMARNWGYEPLIATASHDFGTRSVSDGGVATDGPRHPVAFASGSKNETVAARLTSLRVATEQAWGCENCERRVSQLSQCSAFVHFVNHIVADAPRFRVAYNAALKEYRIANRLRSRNHPAPDLEEGELPFWVMTNIGRQKLTAIEDIDTHALRPRALTLTLFTRLCFGDFFIHGIGGGKYDEVTDDIIRTYFSLEPPAYQVLSATLHLPLPAFASTDDDVKRLEREARDLHWNPQRHLPVEWVADLAREHRRLETEVPTHQFRAERFHGFRRISEQLRPLTADQHAIVERTLMQARSEVAANAILQRRDYSWILYPENVLKPFLQQFLE